MLIWILDLLLSSWAGDELEETEPETGGTGSGREPSLWGVSGIPAPSERAGGSCALPGSRRMEARIREE